MTNPNSGTFAITTALVFADQTVVEELGPVFGVVVRSVGVAKGFTAGFSALAGGEETQSSTHLSLVGRAR